jgi:hypothetical protein
VQILQELIPENQVIAVLMNPDTPFSRLALQELRAAANLQHQRFAIFEARTADDVRVDIESAVKEGTAEKLCAAPEAPTPIRTSLRRWLFELSSGWLIVMRYAATARTRCGRTARRCLRRAPSKFGIEGRTGSSLKSDISQAMAEAGFLRAAFHISLRA